MGECGGSRGNLHAVAKCLAGARESLALAAVATTLCACAGSVREGAMSGVNVRSAARILMAVAEADQIVEVVLPSGGADTVTNCPGDGEQGRRHGGEA